MVYTINSIHRDTKNNITGYRIKDAFGNIQDIDKNKLKNHIRNGDIQLSNYRLTSNNRLVPIKDNLTSKYILMNKDKVVCYFDSSFHILETKDKLPLDFNNIHDWIQSRTKFSCARDVKYFFKAIGIEFTFDFIDILHCISLHDTFWVKRADSKLNWNNVSPFRNNYSQVISIYALEGILITGDKNYFSPVVSTNGSFPHTWKFSKNGIKFIKAGSKYTLGGSNSGREPFSEYYAYKVAEYLKFKCVKYKIRNYTRRDGRIDTITECDCYTSEDIGSIPAYNLGLTSYEDIIEYCKKLSHESYKTIIDMLFLDCLLLNTDRHFQNIEFLIDNSSLKVLDIAPIFDNNCSLLPRFIEGFDKFNRDDYRVRDGRTFDDLYKLVTSHKTYKNELIKLKKFKFTKPESVDISDERLKFLNNLLQSQVKYLLQRYNKG